MARYIDCDKCYHGRVCAYRHHYHDMIVECNHHIPTADVEEVKHAEWKEAEGGLLYFCSNCGYIVEYQLTSGCPNCRAKMDGGKEDV